MDEHWKNRLHSMLQASVQAVEWTYSIFWSLCPQQGVLVWQDGYYNGAIKTRKTVQPTEVSTEEASLQRSEQLRELYETLSAGETNNQPRRPSAALSPEDLTESEWFYLMCISFSFPPGVGIPGKAYTKREHVWLTGANQAHSKVFTRALLAKSAKIQTLMCIPVLDGIVEVGTTQKIKENLKLVHRIQSFFTEHQNLNYPSPALSEHSTSNPHPTISSELHFENSPFLISTINTTIMNNQYLMEAADEKEKDESYSDEDNTCILAQRTGNQCELMQECGDMYDNEIMQDGISLHDSHYSQTISTIIKNQSHIISASTLSCNNSAFSTWSPDYYNHLNLKCPSRSILKYILFTVPRLHTNPYDDVSASHVITERRRREKLNERFKVLKSLIPFVKKTDKASVLGHTIDYVKMLREKIQDYESHNAWKMNILEKVEVSIIQKDILVEIQCLNKERLLLDLMHFLNKCGIQIITVQVFISDGVFKAELRAQVQETVNGRKLSIMEVKSAIHQMLHN